MAMKTGGEDPVPVGKLYVSFVRGKEQFSFEYDYKEMYGCFTRRTQTCLKKYQY